MFPLSRLLRPPWRTVIAGVLFIFTLAAGWFFWSPGTTITDGRHDLAKNGIWLSHGWLGADDWFEKHQKESERTRYRNQSNISNLVAKLRAYGISDLFPHLSPADEKGNLPPIDDEQTELFLNAAEGLRIMPWIGGPWGTGARPWDRKWRTNFISQIEDLLHRHPRLAGVHLNIEPVPAGDTNLISLTADIRAALPPGKILSFAAYPPPTYWHQFPDVHWEEDYFKAIAEHCDQIAVMMYDTGLANEKLYRKLMSDWTRESLEWADPTQVLLGVPTYSDEGVEYHFPEVENITNALLGIHAGLLHSRKPTNYQGIAIYSNWVTDDSEWNHLRQAFLRLNH